MQILESLIKEDDENVEVWILLGHCHERKDKEVAFECWERAQQILEDFLSEEPEDELFQAQLTHIQVLIRQLEED